ncbi:MAG: DUF1549 domain-containing protein, partial [Planctomycetaceae bacterium]|nr:DUF1549 domain-containing protein [Planctomycetaceae bacterium]
MTDSNNHETDSVTDPSHDAELERLLTEAFETPPVPRSLLARIDRSVTAEWGVSPELAPSRTGAWLSRWSRLTEPGRRLVRSLPVAGLIALVVFAFVLFHNNSRSYAWAGVLAAMEQQDTIEISDGDETRWLSLAKGILGIKTPDSFQLIDQHSQVALERQRGTDTVRRRRLKNSDRNALVLSFLAGTSTAGDFTSMSDVRIVGEECETVETNGANEILLQVTFDSSVVNSAGAKPVRRTVSLKLNPESGLPNAVRTEAGQTERSLTLTPAVTLADLRLQELPVNLAVVDADAFDDRSTAVAAADPADKPAGVRTAALPEEGPAIAAIAPNAPTPSLAPEIAPAVRATVDGAASVAASFADAPAIWKAVSPVRLTAADVVASADAILQTLWDKDDVQPTDAAEEAELLRRVYLDLIGRTPSVTEVRKWLKDRSPGRYENLVDGLLNSPDYASHIATVWRSFLIPEGVDLTAFGGVQEFDRWLADRFAGDDSYDEVVRSLLLAEGRLSRSGPLLFYSALKLDPEQLAARTGRVFLGMRLECAQCHDHPFEPW